MKPMVLAMPWPVMRELSPNWRGHWSGARAKKKPQKRAMQARAGWISPAGKQPHREAF